MKIRKLSAILLAGALMASPAVMSTAMAEGSQTDSAESIVDESGNLVIEGTTLTGLTEQGKKAKEIVIPEGVVNFEFGIFSEADNLEKITLPDSLEGFLTEAMSPGYAQFMHNQKLISIEVSKGNKNICSVDGVLFGNFRVNNSENYGFTNSLIRYPANKQGKSYTIPDGVEYVDFCAFFKCTNLESVIIPNSVKIIIHDAFSDCPNLKDVYYEGTEEQFLKIVDDDLPYAFGGATIHYNYVAPTDTDSSTNSNSSGTESSSDSGPTTPTESSSTDAEASTDSETSTDSNSSGSSTTTTPDTGIAGLSLTLGMVALAGVAVVISRKKH